MEVAFIRQVNYLMKGCTVVYAGTLT